MARGATAQSRRRQRRAASAAQGAKRAQGGTLTVEDAAELKALAAGVSKASVAEALGLAGSEQEALAALEAFAKGACAGCDHPYSDHGMDGGECADEGCDCGGYEAASAEAVKATAGPARVTFFFDHVEGGVLASTAASWATANGASFEITDVAIPAELQPRSETPAPNASPAPPAVAAAEHEWTAVFAPEGSPTDDGRIFAPGAIRWRELPLTLMGMKETQEGHDGARVSGRIDRIWRDGNLIRAAGVFDTGEWGQDIARMVAERILNGLSVDIAVEEMDVMYRSEVLDESGAWVEVAEESEGPNMLDVMFGEPNEPVLFVVRSAVIGMATVCPFPAFAEARIEVANSLVAASNPMVWTVTQQGAWTVTRGHASVSLNEEAAAEVEAADGLTASAAGIAPDAPPAGWFADPELAELTPLVVTDDGRVYGHVAPWPQCHIGIPDSCVTPPHSQTGYAYFHLGEVVCDDGSRVTCGTVTLDAPHAGQRLSRQEAAAHYDHTGLAAADVRAGEDEHGIWIAGALRADVDADKARTLRGAKPSGDWRDVNGNLELVAILAVNVPGFPVPRPRASIVASGGGQRMVSLIAAGIHDGEKILFELEPLTPVERDDAAAFAELAALARGPVE